MNREGMKRIGWRLLLGGLGLLFLVASGPVWADAPLAVTLVAFTGRVEQSAVMLVWDTGTEQNTAVTSARFQPTASPAANADGSGAVTTGTESVPPALAQITETPAAYPSAGEETATVAPGEPTPTLPGGYPAGAEPNGTDRVGAGDDPIFGNEAGNGTADETDVTAQVEERGLGSFILWFGFLFGLAVFIAGVIFSIFLSVRDRRTDL